jgi:hypothetical protein
MSPSRRARHEVAVGLPRPRLDDQDQGRGFLRVVLVTWRPWPATPVPGAREQGRAGEAGHGLAWLGET